MWWKVCALASKMLKTVRDISLMLCMAVEGKRSEASGSVGVQNWVITFFFFTTNRVCECVRGLPDHGDRGCSIRMDYKCCRLLLRWETSWAFRLAGSLQARERDACFRYIRGVCVVWDLQMQIENDPFLFCTERNATFLRKKCQYGHRNAPNKKQWHWGRDVISLQANHTRIRKWYQFISFYHSPLFPILCLFTFAHLLFILVGNLSLSASVSERKHPCYCVYLQPHLPQPERLTVKATVWMRQSRTNSFRLFVVQKCSCGLNRAFAMQRWKFSSLLPGLWHLESGRVERNMLLMHSHHHHTSPQGLESSTNTLLLRLKEGLINSIYASVYTGTHLAFTHFDSFSNVEWKKAFPLPRISSTFVSCM